MVEGFLLLEEERRLFYPYTRAENIATILLPNQASVMERWSLGSPSRFCVILISII